MYVGCGLVTTEERLGERHGEVKMGEQKKVREKAHCGNECCLAGALKPRFIHDIMTVHIDALLDQLCVNILLFCQNATPVSILKRHCLIYRTMGAMNG